MNKPIVKYLNKYKSPLKYAKQGDAGIDIRASKDITIGAFETALIPTDLHLELPQGYYARLVGRSSLHKKGLHVNEGIIDNGYRGEVMVSMSNLSEGKVKGTIMSIVNAKLNLDDEINHGELIIEKGDKIAQLIITKIEPVEFVAVEELSETERGNNGFGSTGVN